MVLMVFTFIGILIFWFYMKPEAGSDGQQLPEAPTLIDTDNPYADLFIPSFTLTDSNGELVDESILDGKYTVIDFFYTSCPLVCPGMSAAMRGPQNATSGTDLQLLSISIDPEIDTVDVIKIYSDAYKADPDRWRFTTGDMEMISILLMGMSYDLGALNTDDGFRNIDHPSTLILLGPDRHAIKLYRYSDPDQIEELIKTAHELAG